MEKPLSCKYCGGKELTFHDSLNIFNPDIDDYEDTKDVYECTSCGTLLFEEGEFECILIDTHTIKSNNLHIGESK